MPDLASANLERAVHRVSEEVGNGMTVMNWGRRRENTLWTELVSCILGSGVIFENARSAVKRLNTSGALKFGGLDFDVFERTIARTLAQPVYPPFSKGKGRKYRYPNIRARYIRQTAENIYNDGTLKQILYLAVSPEDARKALMHCAVGIGPKQASLFLRNIGYAQSLAILDVHVLRYMYMVDLVPNCMETVSSLAIYEKLEQLLQHYSREMNLQLGHLDLAIWVVMRVFRREFA